MTPTEKILTQKFTQCRIVCWRDRKNDLHDEFEALELTGVEKIEVKNNEFAVLYRVLRAEPDKKFLIFVSGEEPPPEENWLLDLEVTFDNFYADQTSLWLGELELGYEYGELIRQHREFFTTVKNRNALKKRLVHDETSDAILLKMLGVTVGADSRIDAVLEALMEEAAAGGDQRYGEVIRYHLDGYLWREVGKSYGYRSEKPSVRDFIIRLFRGCYYAAVDPDGTSAKAEKLNGEAQVFISRFKESVRHQDAYEKCSELAAPTLNLDAELPNRELETLASLDLFKEIDRHILNELVARVIARTISDTDCSNIVRARRNTFWYKRLEHTYQAVEFASLFFQTLSMTRLEIPSPADGFKLYVSRYYRLDQLYRQFIFHASASEQKDLLAPLLDKVEKFYSNQYLFKLGNLWQEKLDALTKWELPGVRKQTAFFEKYVEPFLEHEKKVFVIVSDALRYEIAEELRQRLVAEDRYEPTLDAMCSTLPSFTALGMAALLPHRELAIKQAGKGIAVTADDMNTQGTESRAKVLAAKCHSSVLSAEEFCNLTREDGRALFRDNDVAYIYHNRIDMVGDDKMTESQTCAAAEQAIDELIFMIKRLTAYNATNIIVTADHGFIYQHGELSEDEFINGDPAGTALWKVNRRFVIGQELSPIDGMKLFAPEDLGILGDCQIQIPKAINRLRVSGAGSRYVHGGAMFQEIVVPVLKIRKKREGDTSQVEVEILAGMTVITSGQLAVSCYQRTPVGGKILPRSLQLGLYSTSGELISNEMELCFDLTSEQTREREITCSLVLTQNAEKYNGQEVILKLRELVAGTTCWRDYQTRKYQLRRQLMDLDF